MSDSRPVLEPGPDHPITIGPHEGHVTVRRGVAVIAETDRALALHEANYPVVLYVPVADVDQGLLAASDQHIYCPYKGEASYYDIVPNESDTDAGAVWYYPDPYGAVEAIRDHVAFYADRVAITSQS
ncbi:MAG TPA: DUF427 domain-containing protein [Acidimicrobiales bacterium]|jgi:uncharacterized protein (DUF427 family)|nr:DUF427 domain-containing protein [Acidimicrobiales bacterium]